MPDHVKTSKDIAEGSSSKDIAEQGLAIYDRLYRKEFESKWLGRYAAIDIKSEKAIVEDFPEMALASARSTIPDGMFYLVRIGSRGAFKISRRVSERDPPYSDHHTQALIH
jgi:hypothetical protein